MDKHVLQIKARNLPAIRIETMSVDENDRVPERPNNGTFELKINDLLPTKKHRVRSRMKMLYPVNCLLTADGRLNYRTLDRKEGTSLRGNSFQRRLQQKIAFMLQLIATPVPNSSVSVNTQ